MIWNTAKLGDVCFIQSGNSIAAKKKTDLFTNVVGTPYIATKDVDFNGSINYKNGIYIPQEYVNSFKISQSGSTLVCAEGGSAGRKIAFSMNDCCFGNKLFSITPNNSLDAKYIYYYTLNEEFQSQFKAALHGLIGGVSLKKIKEFTISIPPLSEQQRIVALLDTTFAKIDDEISNCKKNIDNIDELFKRKLDYVFDNDDLIRSKEWIKSPLKDLCNNFKADIVDGPFGSNLKKSDYIDTGIEVLKIQNVKPFYINNKKMNFVSEEKYNELQRHSFISGDILMTKLGEPLGVCAIVEELKQGLIVADLVRIRAAKINTKFLCYQLNSPSINRYINSQQTGSGRKRIRLSVARELPILHPSMEVQDEIVKSLDKLKYDIENLSNIYNSKLRNLESFKSSILSHTVSKNIKESAA